MTAKDVDILASIIEQRALIDRQLDRLAVERPDLTEILDQIRQQNRGSTDDVERILEQLRSADNEIDLDYDL